MSRRRILHLLNIMGRLAGGGAYGPQQTLTLQPDAAAGDDLFIRSDSPGSNPDTDVTLRIGNISASSVTYRTLIKFDLSSIPAGSLIDSATLSLFANSDQSLNARTLRVYRLKRAWVETEATWNDYSAAGGAWQTAGAFGANDCEQTDVGSRAFTASETINVFKDFALTPSSVREMISGGAFTNNGWLLKFDTEADDAYFFDSSNSTTAAQRPKLEVVYRAPL